MNGPRGWNPVDDTRWSPADMGSRLKTWIRPTGYGPVAWSGTVFPLCAKPGDFWNGVELTAEMIEEGAR